MTHAARPDYSLGAGEAERTRLLEMCRFLRPAARQAIERVGVAPGWRCLDVGCGPLGILDVLAEWTTPGEVTGLEREPRFLALARQGLDERELTAVRLVSGDATATEFPSDHFDLVHARLVLGNSPDPGAIVAEMTRIVRPGGYVLIQDVSMATWDCTPPHPDWDQLKRALGNSVPGDGEIGGKLVDLLADAGLGDIHCVVVAIDTEPDHPVRQYLPYFVRMHREPIVHSGELAPAELDASLDRLGEHLADPATRAGYPPLYQAWGHKPRAPLRW
jgi:SAM-dependent methyltransferase